jgi:hypothetical protein
VFKGWCTAQRSIDQCSEFVEIVDVHQSIFLYDGPLYILSALAAKGPTPHNQCTTNPFGVDVFSTGLELLKHCLECLKQTTMHVPYIYMHDPYLGTRSRLFSENYKMAVKWKLNLNK